MKNFVFLIKSLIKNQGKMAKKENKVKLDEKKESSIEENLETAKAIANEEEEKIESKILEKEETQEDKTPERNDLVEIRDVELEEVDRGENKFMKGKYKGDDVYLPHQHVVFENEKIYIPYWLYSIKFK